MNKQILLVEDDFDIRSAVRDLLEEEGYEVVDVPDVKTALLRLSSGVKPCAVVLDMMMPGLTGEDFLKSSSEALRLRTVVVTASHLQPGLSCYQVIRKPFAAKTLTETLKRLCIEHPLEELE